MTSPWPTRDNELIIEVHTPRLPGFDQSATLLDLYLGLNRKYFRPGSVTLQSTTSEIRDHLSSWFVKNDIVHYETNTGWRYMIWIERVWAPEAITKLFVLNVTTQNYDTWSWPLNNLQAMDMLTSVGKKFLMQNLDKRVDGPV